MPRKLIALPRRVLRLFIGLSRSGTLSCKMFSDADQLCTIRKEELRNRGSFSCSDCKGQ